MGFFIGVILGMAIITYFSLMDDLPDWLAISRSYIALNIARLIN